MCHICFVSLNIYDLHIILLIIFINKLLAMMVYSIWNIYIINIHCAHFCLRAGHAQRAFYAPGGRLCGNLRPTVFIVRRTRR